MQFGKQIFVIVLALFLAACTSAPAASTSAVASSNTAAPLNTEAAATSVPTEPLVPTLTPTAEGLSLEVLEYYRWTDDNGNPLVNFLVRNPYDFPVKVYDPRVRLLDSTGEIVHRSGDVFFNFALDIGWGRILPGETIAGQICVCLGGGVMEIPDWETFEFVLDIEETEPVAYTTDLEINLGKLIYNDGNSFHAIGTLRNTSDQPLRLAFARLIVRTADGRFVGFGIAGVKGDFFDGRYADIEPGDSFDITVPVYLDSALAGESFVVDVSAIGMVANE